MTLKDQISRDFLEAFKAKETVRKQLLGTIKGEIQTMEKKENAVEMNDEEVIKLLTKFNKSLTQTMELSPSEDTELELKIVSSYLPQLMSEDEIRSKVNELITSGATNMGLIMKEFSTLPCDRKVVSQIVREALA
jgi:uncharacterized protein YqeY